MRWLAGLLVVFGAILVGAYIGVRVGAADQRDRDAVALSRLREMYAQELEVADDNWIDCVLKLPIRYPADTAHQAI